MALVLTASPTGASHDPHVMSRSGTRREPRRPNPEPWLTATSSTTAPPSTRSCTVVTSGNPAGSSRGLEGAPRRERLRRAQRHADQRLDVASPRNNPGGRGRVGAQQPAATPVPKSPAPRRDHPRRCPGRDAVTTPCAVAGRSTALQGSEPAHICEYPNRATQNRLWTHNGPVQTPRVFSECYELNHLIARGGMAEVYRARDRSSTVRGPQGAVP